MKSKGTNRPLKFVKTGMIASIAALACCCGSAFAVSTTLLINQAEQAESGNTSREFVEVRNISNQDQHVDLFTLEWRSASNLTVTPFYKFPPGTIIPANGYYLVVSSTYPDGHPTVTYNASYPVSTGGVLGSNGGVGIRDAAGVLIDSVAWGTITATNHPFVETAPVPSLPTGWSIERQVGEGGLLDHDNNSIDFAVINPPTPTSTAYVPNVPLVTPVTAAPAHLEPGASALITATVVQTVDPVTGVTIDLSPFGGASDVPLTRTTGNLWTATATVPVGQAAGPYTLLVRANDSNGKYGVGGVDLFVYPGPPVSVAIARTKAMNTGELLRVRGLVSSIRTANAYIVDADGNAGIAVSASTPFSGVPPLQLGQDVTITGTLTQDIWTSSSTGQIIYKGEYVLTTATGTTGDIVVNSSNNALPAAKVVTLDDILTDDSLQGRLVSVSDVIVQPPGPSYKVNPVTGDVLTLVDAYSSSAHFYIGVSHNATDQAAVPYPGLPTDPIPAFLDTKSYYLPWTVGGDTFNVRGIVSVTSVNYPTGNLGTRMIRVAGAEDFVLTNNAKFMSATATPAPVEQGATVSLRVVGYPVRIASVTADLSAIGAGTITLSNDFTGGYAAKIRIPSGTPVGDITVPVTVSNGGQTVTGSATITVVARIPRPGDVDRSGAVDLADAVAALKVAAGLVSGDDPLISVANGDVFPKGAPDGKLTLGDSLRILRAVRGFDTL